MKYKVGDKVRVHDTYRGELEGVVVGTYAGKGFYQYRIQKQGQMKPELFCENPEDDPDFPDDYVIGLCAQQEQVPCPFCGAEMRLQVDGYPDDECLTGVFYHCADCGADAPYAYRREDETPEVCIARALKAAQRRPE